MPMSELGDFDVGCFWAQHIEWQGKMLREHDKE